MSCWISAQILITPWISAVASFASSAEKTIARPARRERNHASQSVVHRGLGATLRDGACVGWCRTIRWIERPTGKPGRSTKLAVPVGLAAINRGSAPPYECRPARGRVVPNDPLDREAHRQSPGRLAPVGLAAINRGSAPPYETLREGRVVPNDPLDREAHRQSPGRSGGPRRDQSRLGTTLRNSAVYETWPFRWASPRSIAESMGVCEPLVRNSSSYAGSYLAQSVKFPARSANAGNVTGSPVVVTSAEARGHRRTCRLIPPFVLPRKWQ